MNYCRPCHLPSPGAHCLSCARETPQSIEAYCFMCERPSEKSPCERCGAQVTEAWEEETRERVQGIADYRWQRRLNVIQVLIALGAGALIFLSLLDWGRRQQLSTIEWVLAFFCAAIVTWLISVVGIRIPVSGITKRRSPR